MAKNAKKPKTPKSGRSQRLKLSAEESRRRVKAFPERKEAFIAAIRKAMAKESDPK